MNKFLFYSSILSSFCFQLWFLLFPKFPYKWIYYLCMTTSLCNHGLTSQIAQWIDRIMIIICVVFTIYQLFYFTVDWWFQSIGIGMTLNGLIFYWISKKTGNIIYHIISHFFATISGLCVCICC